MGVSAVIQGAGAIGSGLLNAGSASNAAGAASAAGAKALANIQQAQAQQTANAQPFISNGQAASNQLTQQLPSLTAQFQPTMAQLAATPGYQFTLNQGLQATQNQMSATGLSRSGNATEAAANYASGLASTTYQNQFNNYLAQNQQDYNMLYNQAGQGLSAANSLNANLGQNAAANAGVNVGVGSAQSAAAIAQGQAYGNALTGATNAAAMYNTTQNPAYQAYLSNIANPNGGGAGYNPNTFNASGGGAPS